MKTLINEIKLGQEILYKDIYLDGVDYKESSFGITEPYRHYIHFVCKEYDAEYMFVFVYWNDRQQAIYKLINRFNSNETKSI